MPGGLGHAVVQGLAAHRAPQAVSAHQCVTFHTVAVGKSQLHAIQPGRVSIAREALSGVQAATGIETPVAPVPAPTADAPVNAIQDFAYQAMENLRFDTLEAGVDSVDGRLGVRFHIKGEHDPKVAEVARVGLLDLLSGKAFQKRIPLPAKTPVDLTLDTSINFDELLAAWKRRWQDEASQPPRSDGVQP